MAGKAPGDGMDAESDVHAALAQLRRQLRNRVLGLGDRHAVTRSDDHPVCLGEELGGARDVDLAVFAGLVIRRPGRLDPEPAGDDGDE